MGDFSFYLTYSGGRGLVSVCALDPIGVSDPIGWPRSESGTAVFLKLTP